MDYDINRDTVMIIPINDKKSRVIETNGDYIVDDNAYSIMERSCLYFGSSYEGRLLSSKSILGSVYKAPIVIEESRSIIFFPVKSSVVKQNIWISLNNLVSYNKHDKKTITNKFYWIFLIFLLIVRFLDLLYWNLLFEEEKMKKKTIKSIKIVFF